MVLQFFSIYDKKTQVYGRPYLAHNRGHAMRLVMDELSNNDSQLSRYPADFQLCYLGDYFDDNGKLSGCPVDVVCEINDLIKKDK